MKPHENGAGIGGNGAAHRLSTEAHRQLVQDLSRLRASRVLLVERLERVIAALAMTLDAETAASEQLARLQEAAGAYRLAGRPAHDLCRTAQRYRDVIHALESISHEGAHDRGGTVR